MNNDIIVGLNKKISELERELLNLAKKASLNEAENKRMQIVKEELVKCEKELTTQKEKEQNWNCSYSYKSENGKVSKQFFVNDKEVTEDEYRQFYEKVSNVNRNSNLLLNRMSNEFERMLKSFLSDDFCLIKLLD